MRRGAFKHRLSLYAPASYIFGSEVESWTLIGKAFASISVLEATEGESGVRRQAVELLEFTIPYSRTLSENPTDIVIVYRDVEYEVLGIRNIDYRNKELKIQAKRYEGSKRVLDV
ncbi:MULTISPECIES: head-tail adaptor protein [unclassified Vibrio]|uniref:Head-tail adaptor protein n=1 Tax=Vibrio sp. HB236076 TaxID=3232307 RepID=A0AB39HC55_9VIBR|nr:head-tail adaptor protein [Vibrio sp. HB161653]MDP5253371.1 head-tail adaptor protein [Vibrio sp. HB161653]